MDPFKTMIIMYVFTIVFVFYNVFRYLDKITVLNIALFAVLIVFPFLAILTYYRNIVKGGDIRGK
ncbi:MAG: hypothetical protein DRN04_18455 [Thermoprotei archaeon]|nr:MAG: hypothetical protein DRN04_18455 [Thermoprotei archaeon]RLG74546.1 MAG: hypothetical protein DRO23_06460 [Thermoprotei archaeon]